jgi:hypothetical protein
MIPTDEGMQIEEIVLHPEKQQEHNAAIESGMITSETFPTYSTIALPSKFSKKLSQALKFRLASAIEM